MDAVPCSKQGSRFYDAIRCVFPAHIHVDDVVWDLRYDVPLETKADWKKQFKDKVTEAPDFRLNLQPIADLPDLEEELDMWEDYNEFGQ